MPPVTKTLAETFAEIERIGWSHPHIPYDITLAESERGSVVSGKFALHPADVARRAAADRVAA